MQMAGSIYDLVRSIHSPPHQPQAASPPINLQFCPQPCQLQTTRNTHTNPEPRDHGSTASTSLNRERQEHRDIHLTVPDFIRPRPTGVSESGAETERSHHQDNETFDPINFGSERFLGRDFFFKKNSLSNTWICLVGDFLLSTMVNHH